MRIKKDLHFHTNMSDGSNSPYDMFMTYFKKNYNVLSVTDHGCIDAIPIMSQLCAQHNIKFINGIEISTDDYPNMHILGYSFDETSPALLDLIKTIKHNRRVFLKKAMKILSLHKIDAEHFWALEKDESIEFLYENNVPSDFLYNCEKPSAMQAIEVINESGGVAVLAHPSKLGFSIYTLRNILKKLKTYGLKGLECYHPSQQGKEDKYVRLSREFDLIVTGGSDSHSIDLHNYTEHYQIEIIF